ncbi:MAG: hypothetical protein AB1635_14710 [Acidobacteriota bacterium]
MTIATPTSPVLVGRLLFAGGDATTTQAARKKACRLVQANASPARFVVVEAR